MKKLTSFRLLLSSQFLSALADNAILFIALAILKNLNYSEQYNSLLQEVFVIPYILLAAIIGFYADNIPKNRILIYGNILKLIGGLSLLFGFNPFISYFIIGVGATIYSPAKYGILTEIVDREYLVKANGHLEAATIVAILAGVISGGYLADYSIQIGLFSVIGLYGIATLLSFFIPKLNPLKQKLEEIKKSGSFLNLFIKENISLFKNFFKLLNNAFSNDNIRISLLGTSMFWGIGSTLRFLLIAWVPYALHINDLKTPANLNGAVAIGIVIGAFFAGKFITIEKSYKVLPAGILLGIMISILLFTNNIYLAAIVLLLVGVLGGFFVVPLNALLQEEGHHTFGSGTVIAIQNFMENILILTMLGIYSGLLSLNISIINIGIIFSFILILWFGFLTFTTIQPKTIEKN